MKKERKKMAKSEFKEISKAAVSKKRNIVISDCPKGGFTIAQQALVDDDGVKKCVFFKGALYVADIKGLYNLRDAVNLAIMTVEERGFEEKEEDDWDED